MPAPAGRGQRHLVGGSRRRDAALPTPLVALLRTKWGFPFQTELAKCVQMLGCRNALQVHVGDTTG